MLTSLGHGFDKKTYKKNYTLEVCEANFDLACSICISKVFEANATSENILTNS